MNFTRSASHQLLNWLSAHDRSPSLPFMRSPPGLQELPMPRRGPAPAIAAVGLCSCAVDQRPKVLVVDDGRLNRVILVRVLAKVSTLGPPPLDKVHTLRGVAARCIVACKPVAEQRACRRLASRNFDNCVSTHGHAGHRPGSASNWPCHTPTQRKRLLVHEKVAAAWIAPGVASLLSLTHHNGSACAAGLRCVGSRQRAGGH